MRRKNLLKPQFSSNKSFYGKARVREENGATILTSYQTDVAEISQGKPFVRGLYSNTTTRHIKEFLKQKGFKAESSQQILKDYGKQNVIQTPRDNSSMLKTVAMVASMGDIIGGKTLKEKNTWKTRMLKAGLTNRGLSFPSDWNSLPEKEKKRRLNKSLQVLR